MPGLTPKQEKFAQSVASGMTQADAYRASRDCSRQKDKTIQENACRLMADSKVQARVDELRRPIVEKAQITLESHLASLEALRDSAHKAGQHSAAVAAEVARGKASGVHVEKTANTTTLQGQVEVISRPKLEKEEWLKLHGVGNASLKEKD